MAGHEREKKKKRLARPISEGRFSIKYAEKRRSTRAVSRVRGKEDFFGGEKRRTARASFTILK